MSNLKAVGKLAKNAYKKVPKKEIVNKAAVFGAKQIIGGTYLDVIGFFFKKTKKKAISYAGSYAYDSFLRSKFARDRLNSLPMALVAMIIRTILNFLILSRLVTGMKLLDFTISMIITIIITLSAPFFYLSVKAHEDAFLSYTNNFMDRFMGPGGWEYVEDVKNRIFLSLGFILLILLQFVEVNSKYLQEIIIHTLITGFISDQIQRRINSIPRVTQCHYGMFNTESDMHILGPENYISQLYRTANICHTENRLIIGGKKPQRAIIVPHDKLNDYIKPNNKSVNKSINKSEIKSTNNALTKIKLECIDILTEYDPSLHSTEELEKIEVKYPKN
jgi:hypothetical protein